MIEDFREKPPALPPLTIMNSSIMTVESLRFMGTTISQDLKWDTRIQSSEHQNDQTQKQFLPSGNPTLDNKRGTHNTITQLFIHYIYLFTFQICIISDLYTHNNLYYILCFCQYTLPICILFFIMCVLSFCCHSVALRSFFHYNKLLVCVNIPG